MFARVYFRMSRALADLYGELSARPKNKGLLRKWNVASFTLKELENNWNSLQFAFQHLLVNNEPTTLSPEKNHIPLRKKEPRLVQKLSVV